MIEMDIIECSNARSECGLPPLQPFPPSSSMENNGTDSLIIASNQEVVWENQLKEEQLINAANEKIQWIFTRLRDHTNAIEDCRGNFDEFFPNMKQKSTFTIYDLKWIAKAMSSSSIEISAFLQSLNTLEAVDVSADDTGLTEYWKEIIINTNEWENVLLRPLREAASEIVAIYRTLNQGGKKAKNEATYLQYKARETLRTIKQSTLPSLKQRSHMQQNQLRKMRTLQKESEERYNAKFKELDEYCIHVLSVESDTLPLCPLDKTDSDKMDLFAREIGKCVIKSLRDEFCTLTERFIGLIAEPSCLRDDIIQAMTYYHSFVNFANFASRNSSDVKDDLPLQTLYRFTTNNEDNRMQFKDSPTVRVQLVTNLQQLDAFLACRKKEIDASSSKGFGHIVKESVGMEWTRFCMQQTSTSNIDHSCSQRLGGINIDDITRFKNATDKILQQIVGDGGHAKRLRLLSDAVGYNSTQELSPYLTRLCHEAANHLRQMSSIDEQSKALVSPIKKLASNIITNKQEMQALVARVTYISEGLKSNQ